MDTEEKNEDSPAGEQTSEKLEELEKIDIDDNNNINHQSTETNLPEEATESKSECVTMEIKTPIKEEEQEEDLRETTSEDSSNNNTTQVQKEEETTISEPERVSLEPFGSERKTAASSGEMITCNETNKIHEVRVENAPGAQVGRVPEEKTRGEQEKVTEHFTSLKSVTVSEKEIAMDNMVSNESNTTKQIHEQAAYPLLTLEREETIPTSSTDANGTPKDSITPHMELGAEAKNIQYMQEKCKTSETEQHQENYENKKEVECDSKEVPEESISRETQAKAALSDLVHVSTKETSKIEEDFAEEREGNDREEEGIQKKREVSSSEDPVIVEISRDADIKVPPKKHQNILSGVGSKVKHSIAKVKKAITGKSSQTKPSSPK
uniref:Microtubule-associated protein futsch n=3 Tax=Solanum TaxID=4107 RepID=M1AY92_SOLTU